MMSPSLPPHQEEEAAVPPAKCQSFVLPKASLARLIKDAGARVSPTEQERLQKDLFEFLSVVLRHTRRALLFTKHKSVSRGHVEFAIGAAGKPLLAKRAKNFKDKDLDRLHRCNIYAAPTTRREPVGAVEISEATFARLIRSMAKVEHLTGRFGARARKLLHLCSEEYIVSLASKGDTEGNATQSETGQNLTMSPSSSLQDPSASRTTLTAGAVPPAFVTRALAEAFCIPESKAQRVSVAFEIIASRLDPLLEAKSTKTVGDDLLQVALADIIDLESMNEVHEETMKTPTWRHGQRIVENLLRGRAPDRWVTQPCIHLLMKCLWNLALLGENDPLIQDTDS